MTHHRQVELLTSKEFATMIQISENAAAKMRMEGTGPVFIKIGRRVMYHPDDISAWIDANRQTRTVA